jgi:uncharacterized membrane protein YuzA (DUF378 family)
MFDSDMWTEKYVEKMIYKNAIFFIILGSINYVLVGLFNINLVENIFGNGAISTILYIIMLLSILYLVFKRDTYLPFLGETHTPCSVLQNQEPPGATREVKIAITPNTKVIYWASEPKNANLEKINSWKQAYQQYQNAGVATSNSDGVAILKVRDPQSYHVPYKGELKPHVHYRVCGDAGWMGRINTVHINSTPEGFENYKTDKKYKVTNLADTSASIY